MVATSPPTARFLAAPQSSAPIDAMLWEQLVLLVFAPGERDGTLSKQRKMFGAGNQGFRDRALRIVEVVGESVSGARDYAPRLRQRYRVGGAEFAALFIGRDGRVSLRSNHPIDSAQLFDAIDANPAPVALASAA